MKLEQGQKVIKLTFFMHVFEDNPNRTTGVSRWAGAVMRKPIVVKIFLSEIDGQIFKRTNFKTDRFPNKYTN